RKLARAVGQRHLVERLLRGAGDGERGGAMLRELRDRRRLLLGSGGGGGLGGCGGGRRGRGGRRGLHGGDRGGELDRGARVGRRVFGGALLVVALVLRVVQCHVLRVGVV